MHAFKCPKCGRMLATAAPMKKATVKCRACGTAFVGDTTPMLSAAPEKQASAAAASQGTRAIYKAAAARPAASVRPVLRAGPSNTRLMLIVTLSVMVVGLTIMVVVAALYYGTVEIKYTDASGQEVTQRVSKEEALAIKEDLARKAESAAQATANQPVKAGGQASGASAAQDKSDPNIYSLGWNKTPYMASLDAGYIVGQVKSTHDACLRSLDLTLVLLDKDGKELLTVTASPLQFVPAEGSVKFAAYFEGVKLDDIKDVKMTARATPDPGMLCWEANEAQVQLDHDKLSVTGTATVGGKQDIRDAEIYCEFRTPDGALIKAVPGEVQGAHAQLRAGTKVKFTAILPLEDMAPPVGVQASVRLVGTVDK